MRLILFTIAVAGMVAGCASGLTRLGPEYPPRPENAWVSVYLSGSAPYCTHDLTNEVGNPPGMPIARDTVGGPFGTSMRMLLDKAKSVAREAGGDGLLITGGDTLPPTLSFTIYRQPEQEHGPAGP